MPRRSILSATERESLLALPDAKDDLIRYYTFNETDLSAIRQRRGAANRLGFAVQLCYLRFPGIFLGVDEPPLLQYLSPLGWEHINLTGDYLWRSSAKVGAGKFRPLRPLPPA